MFISNINVNINVLYDLYLLKLQFKNTGLHFKLIFTQINNLKILKYNFRDIYLTIY